MFSGVGEGGRFNGATPRVQEDGKKVTLSFRRKNTSTHTHLKFKPEDTTDLEILYQVWAKLKENLKTLQLCLGGSHRKSLQSLRKMGKRGNQGF